MRRTLFPTFQTRHSAHRKTVLFVVNDASFFLSHRGALAVAALRRGYKVLLASPPGKAVKSVEELGINWFPLKMSRWGTNPLIELQTVVSLLKLYRRTRPDVVHHVTIKPVIYGSLAAHITGVPRVINAISGFGYVFVKRGLIATIRKFLVNILYRIVQLNPRQRTIFQNSDDYSYFLKNISRKTDRYRIIRGSGINLKKYRALPLPDSSRPVIMFIGRLLEDKGIREYVQAAQNLKSQGMVARFVVVGDRVEGNPSSISEELLFQWIDEGSVEFWGYRENVYSCLEQADVVCLPSYREGLPRVLLEAASCSRPIVTTDVPGCREVVKDGFNGLLVEARSVEKLQKALSILLLDRELRNEMARKSRLFIENGDFSEFHVTAQTLSLYERG